MKMQFVWILGYIYGEIYGDRLGATQHWELSHSSQLGLYVLYLYLYLYLYLSSGVDPVP